MGDMGKPLPASRLATLPVISHTAVITQVDLLQAFLEPFLKGGDACSSRDGLRISVRCTGAPPPARAGAADTSKCGLSTPRTLGS